MSRLGLSVVSFAVGAVCVGLVVWLLTDGDSGAPQSALSVESAQAVEIRSSGREMADALSTPVSPVFILTSAGPLKEPITLRFDLSVADDADLSRLRVAFRESASDEWSLTRGRVDEDSYVVETSHLSEWQLRELHCKDRLTGPISYRIDVENSDQDDPLLYACAQEIGGKPGLVVFNNRSIGLEFPVLEGVDVVRTGSRTLAERAWGYLNSIQYGEPWLLVPGDGFVTLAFDSLPEELTFDATNSAFVFDLLLSVGGGAESAFVECAHTFAESMRTFELNFSEVRKILLDGIIACGGRLGDLVGIQRLLSTVWDSVGAITESATVSFAQDEPTRLPEPSSTLRLPGPVDFSGIAPIRIGMTKADAEAVTGLHFLGPRILGGCGELRPSPGMGDATEDDYLPGVSLMVVGPRRGDLYLHGRIVRVDVFKPGYTTAAGIGLGSSEAEVTSAYRPYVEVTPHEYASGHYLTVRSPDPALERYRIVFETDGHYVTSFRAGQRPQVEFVEHCL